jgi:hypothetical protein
MTENYDKTCVEEALHQHSKTLKHAISAHELCRTGFTIGGGVLGYVAGLPVTPIFAGVSGLAGASVGTMVGSFACEHISGVEQAVKPPVLTHCSHPPVDKGSKR